MGIKLTMEEPEEIKMEAKTNYNVYTDNYEDLINLPTFNGKTFKGDVTESDPTVPSWAKAETPGEGITPESINAVSKDDVIPLTYLASLFDEGE